MKFELLNYVPNEVDRKAASLGAKIVDDEQPHLTKWALQQGAIQIAYIGTPMLPTAQYDIVVGFGLVYRLSGLGHQTPWHIDLIVNNSVTYDLPRYTTLEQARAAWLALIPFLNRSSPCWRSASTSTRRPYSNAC